MSNRVTEEWLRANYPEADAVLSGKAEAPPAPVAPARPKRSKYGAIPTVYNGVRYASKAEATRAERLDFDASIGLVVLWIGQPKFRLGCPENIYVSDFLVVYRDAPGEPLKVRVEDVKGAETAKYRHDRRLWARYGPCPLWVFRNGKVAEVIEPGEGK